MVAGRDRDRRLSLGILILITNTRPGYDPYGWLDWGYQTLRGSLNLGGAPSWKPFTYLLHGPVLDLRPLRAVAVDAHRRLDVTHRRCVRWPDRLPADRARRQHRWPAIVAAVFAGAAVLGIQEYFHYILSVQSDPMLVAVCLAAIDCHLNGHHRWAWWLAALASLGRPEVWPFAGLYAIWACAQAPRDALDALRRRAHQRLPVVRRPEITNGRPNIAGQLALRSPRELHQTRSSAPRPLHRAGLPAVELAALIAIGSRSLRRNWTVLTLAGWPPAWVIVEIALRAARLPRRPALPVRARRADRRAGRGRRRLAAAGRQSDQRRAAQLGRDPGGRASWSPSMVPRAISQARTEHKDVYHERAAHQRDQQARRRPSTRSAATSTCRRCGRPVVNVEYVSIMAWYTASQHRLDRPPPEVRAAPRSTRSCCSRRSPTAGRSALPHHRPAWQSTLREPERALRAHRRHPTAC